MAVGVNIVSEFNSKGIDKAIKDFKKLEGGMDKTAFSLKTMDKAVTNGITKLAKFGAVVGVVAGVVGKQLVDAASDLQESISKVNVVFGESSKEIHDFAKNAAVSMGISRQEALEAAGTYGNLLQAFGTSREEAAKMSTTMVQLAGDLASFNNVPIGDALQAIRSGLSGEAEPLKRFGVAINDVRLKEEALRMGLYKGSGQLSVLAKSQAAYSLILKDTSLAQGDYARTSDGVANTQRSLMATFKDIKAELGTALIPVYQTLLGFLNDKLMPIFREFSDIVGKEGLGAAFKYLGTEGLNAIGKLSGWGNLIFGIVGAVIALKVATIAYTIAQGAATIAVSAFGVAWNATGIGLVVSLIALLITGIVLLAIRFKGFRDILIGAWNVIIDAIQKGINLITGYWEFWINTFIKGVNFLIRGWNKIPFTNKIDELKEVNLQLDITGAKIDNMGKKYAGAGASAAAFRKAEEEGMKQFNASQGGGTGTGTGTGGGTGGGGAGGGGGSSAVDKMKERLKKYADLVKSTTSLQKDLEKAVKSTSDANNKLAEANTKLATAQQSFLQVTQGFGATSKQAMTATQAAEQAQRDEIRAGFDLERAKFAVTEAEKALNEARKEGDPVQIREAEIALAEATMTVTEKQIALKTATDATAEAQRLLNGTIAGFPAESEEYKTSLSELTQAQGDAKAAVDAVADAKDRELEITNQLIAANAKLAKLKITKKQAKQVAQSMKSAGVTITPAMWQTLGITPFAKGGIVMSPVNALIGEAGPEAVIPLDRFDGMMGGDVYHIQINSKIADESLPDMLVAELRKFNRRSGAINIQVA
jgi:uncharacterized membrane protein YgcG